MATRKESAADIRVSIDDDTDVVVSRLQLTKDIDVEQLGGSGKMIPDHYSINQITYQGTMELNGNKLDLQEQFFDENGIPIVADGITVTHQNGESTAYTEVIVTSEGWEMNEGESTTTTYEFIAMGREHGGVVDTNPQ